MLLRQGKGVPSGAILWELAALSMGRRVWREKLCLSLHIARLGEETLARQVWEEQQVFLWPGLAMEAEHIAKELEVESVNTTELSKKEYRDSVTEACHRYNKKMLKGKIEGKKKCEKIVSEEYGRKSYFEKLIPGEVGDYFSMVEMCNSLSPLCGTTSSTRHLPGEY
jgi:hypothetical protein